MKTGAAGYQPTQKYVQTEHIVKQPQVETKTEKDDGQKSGYEVKSNDGLISVKKADAGEIAKFQKGIDLVNNSYIESFDEITKANLDKCGGDKEKSFLKTTQMADEILGSRLPPEIKRGALKNLYTRYAAIHAPEDKNKQTHVADYLYDKYCPDNVKTAKTTITATEAKTAFGRSSKLDIGIGKSGVSVTAMNVSPKEVAQSYLEFLQRIY